jgi:hypothetical protein
VIVVLVIGVGFLALAVLAIRDGDREPDALARAHAESACDLTAGANEAARVKTDARYAATVLVLDRAILESERAAKADPRFADLDQALKAVHTAAHTGDPETYDTAMDRAQAACSNALR